MKITICIGSSCHVKGSRQVLERLQTLIAENKLGDKIELSGTFCVGQCQKGVCVLIDEELYSVTPDSAEEFFNNTVLPNLK